MAVMDVGHVSMLVLGAGMLMLVCVSNIILIMNVELITDMSMFMKDRHMNMKMGMFLIRQQQRACNHQYRSDTKQQCERVFENKNGKQYTCERSCAVQRAGARGAQSTHGVDEEHGAESVTDKAKQKDA